VRRRPHHVRRLAGRAGPAGRRRPVGTGPAPPLHRRGDVRLPSSPRPTRPRWRAPCGDPAGPPSTSTACRSPLARTTWSSPRCRGTAGRSRRTVALDLRVTPELHRAGLARRRSGRSRTPGRRPDWRRPTASGCATVLPPTRWRSC
jgi:hypothetical protein